MLMIAEPGCMCGSTSRISRNGARSIRPRKWSSRSSSVSCTGLGLPIPATLTRKSMRPHVSTARSAIRLGASSSRRSATCVATRPGSPTACASSVSLPSLRPVASTAMPCSASFVAQPNPIPPLAPVTIASSMSLAFLHQRRLNLMLQDLSRIVFRQDVPDDDLLRNFEPRDAFLLEEAAQAREVGPGCGAGDHDGAGPLSGAVVGQADDGDFGDPGVAGQNVLHLLGGDVLAVADDDVFGASGDHQAVTVDPARQVPGAEIPVGVKRLGLVLGMLVPDQHLRSSHADLPVAVESHLGETDPAVGVGGPLAVARRTYGGGRGFRRAQTAGQRAGLEQVLGPGDQ